MRERPSGFPGTASQRRLGTLPASPPFASSARRARCTRKKGNDWMWGETLMRQIWSRRKMVGTTAGAIAGLGLIGTGLRLRSGRAGSSAEGDGDEELGRRPPRVVGLRTSGGNFRFDPVGLRIEPGTRVIWLNMGDFHSSTAFHPDHSHLLGGASFVIGFSLILTRDSFRILIPSFTSASSRNLICD